MVPRAPFQVEFWASPCCCASTCRMRRALRLKVIVPVAGVAKQPAYGTLEPLLWRYDALRACGRSLNKWNAERTSPHPLCSIVRQL